MAQVMEAHTVRFSRTHGKELSDDESLVWYDYGARMYDVQIGRWASHDPVYQMATPYGYCGNNAIDFYDPDGRKYRPNGSWISYDIYESPNDPNTDQDDLDKSKNWGNNILGTIYPGPNNPVTKSGAYYYGNFEELSLIDFPGVEHDQAYDKLGITNGVTGLPLDPRAYKADKVFVNKTYIAGAQCFFEGNYEDAAKAGVIAAGLHVISEGKAPGVITYYSIIGASESTSFITENRTKLNNPTIEMIDASPSFVSFQLQPVVWQLKVEKYAYGKIAGFSGSVKSKLDQFIKWGLIYD